jgi:hypothetical protein
MARIELNHVTKRYPGGAPAVDDLTLDIPDREFMVLVGPQGQPKVERTTRPPRGPGGGHLGAVLVRPHSGHAIPRQPGTSPAVPRTPPRHKPLLPDARRGTRDAV